MWVCEYRMSRGYPPAKVVYALSASDLRFPLRNTRQYSYAIFLCIELGRLGVCLAHIQLMLVLIESAGFARLLSTSICRSLTAALATLRAAAPIANFVRAFCILACCYECGRSLSTLETSFRGADKISQIGEFFGCLIFGRFSMSRAGTM